MYEQDTPSLINSFIGLDTLSLPTTLVDVVFRLIFAGLVMLIGFKLTNFLVKRMHRKKQSKNLDPSAFSFLTSTLSIAFKVITCVTAASILGLPLSAIVTVISSCGLAIGLALQGSLSNFAGGVMILLFRPFSVGDYISNHTDEGTVTDISIFYTTLRTTDNRRIMIPNGALSNASIINVTAYDTRRVDIPLTASYSCNIDRVIEVIKETASKNELILKEKGVDAKMTAQGDSSLSFFCRVWTRKEDYWQVKYELTKALKEAFDEAGIEIPFPQVDVHQR